MAERLTLEQERNGTTDAADEDADLIAAFRVAQETDELLQNNVTFSGGVLTPGEVAALRGLWRGRAAAQPKIDAMREAERKRLAAQR